MFTQSIVVAVMAIAGFASAQNYSTSGNISVVPDSVPYAMRQEWCKAQTENCPQICKVPTVMNTCDPNTLTYNCTCSGGVQPNISDYQQTLPGQECLQWRIDCVAAHPDDAYGQAGCHSVVCGNKTVAAVSTGSSSSSGMMTSTSSSASTSGTGGAGGAAATPTSSSSTHASTGAAATAFVGLAQQYGTPLMAGGMAALFGLAL